MIEKNVFMVLKYSLLTARVRLPDGRRDCAADRRFKRRHLFIRTHNKALSFVAVRVSNATAHCSRVSSSRSIRGRFRPRPVDAKKVKAKSEVAITPKREGAPTLTWHCKIPPTRNGRETEE